MGVLQPNFSLCPILLLSPSFLGLISLLHVNFHIRICILGNPTRNGVILICFFIKHLFFNWRIIALQNFVLFCQISAWINHRCTYAPSLLNVPPSRTRKQPRCPPTDEWIKEFWCICTMEYYSTIERNAFESVLIRWMNLEPTIQSEVSQKEKGKYRMLMHIYGI